MIIKGISIQSKLLLATGITLLFLLVALLVLMDASSRISSQNALVSERSALLSEMRSLEISFYRLSREGTSELLAKCSGSARRLESRIRDLSSQESLARDEGISLVAEQALHTLNLLVNDLRLPSGPDSTMWAQAGTDLAVLGELVEGFDRSLFQWQEGSVRDHRVKLAVTLALFVFLISTYLVLFSISLNRALGKLMAFTRQLREGKLPPPLGTSSGDEFGQIANDLNLHTASLHKKIGTISSLTEEGPVELYEPDPEDELGNALLVLSDYLIRKELDEVTRNREDKKQNWISEGMAQLGEVMRSERENTEELSFAIIQKLVAHMTVEMGSLFISNFSDPEHPTLELAASYAYDRHKYQSRSLDWGVGLPGTCAQEKKRIFLTEVPDDYFKISSGTGWSKPNCLLLVPMLIKDRVYGIVELATVRLLKPFEIEFVESLATSIASSIQAVQINERTAGLLKQSQAQSEALRTQETVMLENMKQLEEAQAESRKKESEITGILNAIENSALVAELGLNGRFTSINDRFLILLESQRELVLGKLHSEFAQVDPYRDEYKEFWSALREGKSKSNIEAYRLFSGKEIWLQQTFTPIINNEGNVYKILNIAVDITVTRTLQEQLDTRELEITRRNLDMQSLKEAVNTALIKCDLDAEGIIIDVNDKYAEVTGYGRKELLGRNYRLFLTDSEKELFEKIWEEVKKEKVYEGVIRRSRPTGEEAWLVSTFSPVVDEGGIIYKVYFMGFDITEKKLKYQLLEDANQEIERLRERLKDDES